MTKILLMIGLQCLATIEYAQSIPRFKAILANATDMYITKEAILAEPVVSASPTPSIVTEFTISIMPKRGDLVGPFKISGNRLNEKVLAQVNRMEGGAKIYIEEVKVRSGKLYMARNTTYSVQ